jgi:hypothetical protein
MQQCADDGDTLLLTLGELPDRSQPVSLHFQLGGHPPGALPQVLQFRCRALDETTGQQTIFFRRKIVQQCKMLKHKPQMPQTLG